LTTEAFAKGNLMSVEDAVADELLDHARSSHWRGELPGATHRVRQRNPTCGDEVALAVRFLADLQPQSCSDLLGFDPARLATGRQGCVRLAYAAWQKLLARVVDEPRGSSSVSGVKEDCCRRFLRITRSVSLRTTGVQPRRSRFGRVPRKLCRWR